MDELMELTLEDKLDIAVRDYQIAFESVIKNEVSNYMKMGLTEDDASIIVGQKAKVWLDNHGK